MHNTLLETTRHPYRGRVSDFTHLCMSCPPLTAHAVPDALPNRFLTCPGVITECVFVPRLHALTFDATISRSQTFLINLVSQVTKCSVWTTWDRGWRKGFGVLRTQVHDEQEWRSEDFSGWTSGGWWRSEHVDRIGLHVYFFNDPSVSTAASGVLGPPPSVTGWEAGRHPGQPSYRSKTLKGCGKSSGKINVWMYTMHSLSLTVCGGLQY